jgi:hypothetical protein
MAPSGRVNIGFTVVSALVLYTYLRDAMVASEPQSAKAASAAEPTIAPMADGMEFETFESAIPSEAVLKVLYCSS